MAEQQPAVPTPPRTETVEAIRFFESQAATGTTPDMSDSRALSRAEPLLDTGPAAGTGEPVLVTSEPVILRPREPAPESPAAFPQGQFSPAAPTPAPERRGSSEQLARLEEKAARIEDKLARSEANTQRVVDRFELASARMGEVALQADLAAVRGEVSFIARRVRGLPGFSALVLTAVITAVLTSTLTAILFRFVPGLLGR